MTKIIAHRGASKAAPQNTLAAFKKAKAFGAHGFENDVHYTKDGVIVVCHNYTVEATSNGQGAISEMTFEELRKLDFGSYFSPEFAGEKIPTLAEFYEVGKGLDILNVEIKTPLDNNLSIVKGVIDMAKECGVFDSLLISSFNEGVLREARRLDDHVMTGVLYDPRCEIAEKVMPDPFGFAKDVGATHLHPVFLLVDDEYIERAHELGFKVNVWTPNQDYVIKTFLEWGCDGLITDVPDLALKVLNDFTA